MQKQLLARVEEINRIYGGSKNADRIISELKYLLKLSYYDDNRYLKDLSKAVELLEKITTKDKTVTFDTVETIETALQKLSGWAKKIEVLCVAHAHIDMNWQWGWHETVQITLDTFRTMLDMMEKYPDFKYSQSQASCYKIVEDYDNAMLDEIRKRVKEGRWEVSASTWVEGDRNMANMESMFRHYLYARKYLVNLLNIKIEDLNFDFEPDTFGHNANIPEILSKCGIKYYYFCRGYDNPQKAIFRWQSSSGNEIIAHTEPVWYMHVIQGKIFDNVPEFCSNNKVKKYLVVYGVGDHGGGPTRRDIETIISMRDWPLIPAIKFSTYKEYFTYLETLRNKFPVVKQEMNFIFDGCYSSQSSIKMANRFGEEAMYDAELYSVIANSITGKPYEKELFEKAWRNVLFNHFHDILPGSGVKETREYASGLFQDTMAVANTSKMNSLRAIASKIKIDGVWPENDRGEGLSEGAGVGHGGKYWRMSQVERCDGKTRIFHVFNSLPFARREVLEISLWDWNYDKSRLACKDGTGNILPLQVLNDNHSDWLHNCFQFLVCVDIPACGYSTFIVTEDDKLCLAAAKDPNPRIIKNTAPVMENDYLRAEFNIYGVLLSLIVKASGKELIDNNRGGAAFRFGEEYGGGMSSWTIWPLRNVENLNKNIELLENVKGEVRQFLKYQVSFRSSKLLFTVSLDKNSKYLEYKCEVDWREFGKLKEIIPQLQFYTPLKSKTKKFINDIPGGTINRQCVDNDVPGLSFIAGGGVQLITDCKYGYRGWNNAMSVTLIRSSFEPDEHPEIGKHYFKFALQPSENENKQLLGNSLLFCKRPDIISTYKRTSGGILPLSSQFLSLRGSAELSGVKLSEDNKGMIIRLYSTEDKVSRADLELPCKIVSAYEIDGNEQPADFGAKITFSEKTLKVILKPFSAHSVLVKTKS